MKKILSLFLIGLACSCRQPDVSHLEKETVVPKPVSVQKKTGKFVFSSSTCWVTETEEQRNAADYMITLFGNAAGWKMERTDRENAGEENAVRFYTDSLLKPEAYRLDVRSSGIRIYASSAAGFFYAVQTLRQMLPAAIEAGAVCPDKEWSIPAVEITDEPRFGYRGFMLDVARYFMSKENLLKLIDCMGMLKLNKLHLHLVDDQGWRLEIKKYPRLTEIGAWRVEREEEFPARPAPLPGEKTPVGGFYTQQDIKEIVAYAAARAIEVIPEIEMPAHTTSSLAAYPELACNTKGKFVGVLPGFGGFAPVYCAGNEKVFKFLEDVIDEVAALFPSRYIHIGGDEATKTFWKACPKCQARMKAEKLPDEEELQGYFIQRIGRYIRSKGKMLIGWDELTNSTLPEEAIIVGWRGRGEAAFKAARQGHPYILAPAQVVYLIRYQGPQWFEPRTYFGNNTLADVYRYEPLQEGIEPAWADLLMGVQACLWTEFTHSAREAEYLIFPRLTALAEVAWSPQDQRDWENYLGRLDQLLLHLETAGVNYARSMFNPDHEVRPDQGGLNVHLSCIRPDVEIHYTLDGSEPTVRSLLYTEPLKVNKDEVIKAATFKEGQKKGSTLQLDLKMNRATACPVRGNQDKLYLLVNGLRGSDKQSDFEWCGWYGKDGEWTVDLGKIMKIGEVNLGTILNYGMGAHLPESVILSVSEDGDHFQEAVRKTNRKEDIFARGIRTGLMEFKGLNINGRYLKVKFTNPGNCPAGHPREGQPTWVYFDEFTVN